MHYNVGLRLLSYEIASAHKAKRSWYFTDIEAVQLGFGFPSDLSAKMLNHAEDAHIKDMSTFETR